MSDEQTKLARLLYRDGPPEITPLGLPAIKRGVKSAPMPLLTAAVQILKRPAGIALEAHPIDGETLTAEDLAAALAEAQAAAEEAAEKQAKRLRQAEQDLAEAEAAAKEALDQVPTGITLGDLQTLSAVPRKERIVTAETSPAAQDTPDPTDDAPDESTTVPAGDAIQDDPGASDSKADKSKTKGGKR